MQIIQCEIERELLGLHASPKWLACVQPARWWWHADPVLLYIGLEEN